MQGFLRNFAVKGAPATSSCAHLTSLLHKFLEGNAPTPIPGNSTFHPSSTPSANTVVVSSMCSFKIKEPSGKNQRKEAHPQPAALCPKASLKAWRAHALLHTPESMGLGTPESVVFMSILLINSAGNAGKLLPWKSVSVHHTPSSPSATSIRLPLT